MRRSYLDYLLKKFKEGDLLLPFKSIYRCTGIFLSQIFGRPFVGPLHASIVATYACNLRCGMCNLWKRELLYKKEGKKELTTNEMKKIISDFASIGTSGIGFTGGEPVLRKDMLYLIKYTKNKGLVTHMSTNGFLMNETMVKKILDSGLDAIGFSLDGCNPQTHDKIRGVKGSFDKVISGINNFINLREKENKNIVVIVVCVISRKNIDEILDLVVLLEKIGVDRISFIPFHDIGILTKGHETMKEFKIRKNELAKIDSIIDKLIEIKKKKGIIESSERYLRLFKRFFRNRNLPIPCYAGYATFAVDGYGDMYTCFPMMEMGIAKAAENVRNVSLKKYWYSKQLKLERKKIHSCRKCYWNNQTELNLLFHPWLIPKK